MVSRSPIGHMRRKKEGVKRIVRPAANSESQQ